MILYLMSVLDLIFPKSCLECGLIGKYICKTCLEKVPLVGWHGKRNYSVWGYKGVVRKALISLKYKYSTDIAKELSNEVVKILRLEVLRPNEGLLIPIPLHWQKKNLR